LFLQTFLKPKSLSLDKAEFFSIFGRKVTIGEGKGEGKISYLAKLSFNTHRLGWVLRFRLHLGLGLICQNMGLAKTSD
jgi:hypothetical protein